MEAVKGGSGAESVYGLHLWRDYICLFFFCAVLWFSVTCIFWECFWKGHGSNCSHDHMFMHWIMGTKLSVWQYQLSNGSTVLVFIVLILVNCSFTVVVQQTRHSTSYIHPLWQIESKDKDELECSYNSWGSGPCGLGLHVLWSNDSWDSDNFLLTDGSENSHINLKYLLFTSRETVSTWAPKSQCYLNKKY